MYHLCVYMYTFASQCLCVLVYKFVESVQIWYHSFMADDMFVI